MKNIKGISSMTSNELKDRLASERNFADFDKSAKARKNRKARIEELENELAERMFYAPEVTP